MRQLRNLVVFIGIVCVVAVAARNIIVKNIAISAVKKTTGLDMKVGRLDIGIFAPVVSLRDVVIGNPQSYADPTMVSLPELTVQYDLGALLQQKAHIKMMVFNLKELSLFRNDKGQMNVSAFDSVIPKKNDGQKPPEIAIDVLELKIGKVVFKDYSKGTPPAVSEYHLNIDERLENITNMGSLSQFVLNKAVSRAGLGSMIGVNIGTVQNTVEGSMSVVGTAAQEVTKQAVSVGKDAQQKAVEAVQDAVKQLKGLLPAEEEKK